MGKTLGFIYKVAITLVLLSFLVPWAQLHAQGKEQVSAITEWQMLWEQPGEEMTIEQVSALDDEDGWFPVKAGGEYPVVPEHVNTAWIKFQLPELTQMRPALDISKLYAKSVEIFIDQHVVYQKIRNYSFDQNEVILNLHQNESFKTLYMKLSVQSDRVGLHKEVHVDEYDKVFKSFIKRDLFDVVLGASLIFISFFMIVSVLFLNKTFQPGWNSLFLVMLSIGIMILTYSTFLDKFFPELGVLFYVLFDIASSILLPALFFFFEKVFGKGPYGLIRTYKNIQFVFAIIYIFVLIMSIYSETINSIYYNFGYIFFGLSIVLGNILLIYSLIYECRSKNKEAVILAIGISIFAGVGLLEILWFFYSKRMYTMFYWKISILCFLASLIIILVRRVMVNYKQAVQYSKQIEIFNNELQRSEKIELISNLAASIAHEVRNPLQVTRGFLQLIGEKSTQSRDKSYTSLAITELDRASEIITDFLTFAKPDLGKVSELNLPEEINQIVAIMAPLSTMQGGVIKVISDEEVLIKGNSSKFKQALINIIKNSIEAWGDNGEIIINIMHDKESGEILLTITDNGEGIEPEDLKRLGEPYYSKKTKGTGLGLMVTYRIIEAMNGKITFSSKKGVGTEVSIRFSV